MTTLAESLLADFEGELSRSLTDLAGERAVDIALVVWVLGPEDHIPSTKDLSEVRSHVGAQRTYPDVATLGYLIAAGDKSSEIPGSLETGLLWLAGRRAEFEGRPVEFVQDPVALLGVALGTHYLGRNAVTSSVRDWFSAFRDVAFHVARNEPWQRALVAAASELLEVSAPALTSTELVADVRLALKRKGLLGGLNAELDGLLALEAIRSGSPTCVSHAALRLAALRWLRRSASIPIAPRPGPQTVIGLLRGFPNAFARWTWEDKPKTKNSEARKWHVDHEYHVQNLLWFLLVTIFPDLRAEEYLPQVGHRQPRVDLGIPSLQLLVEVKFVRKDASFSDLIEEIGSDVSLYLTPGSHYKQIFVFVWDNSRRTEQYDKLRSGLLQLRGVVDAVIVPRPGCMEEMVKPTPDVQSSTKPSQQTQPPDS